MNTVKSSAGYIDGNRAKVLLEKWAPILDFSSKKVAPIEDAHIRLSTAIVLENQERYCMNEASNTGGGTGGAFTAYSGTVNAGAAGGTVGNQDFYATGDSRLPKILIPMIRRTFPELITNEIVGVQPMSGPVGLAFALRYRYESDPLANYSPDGGSTANGGRPWRDQSDGTEVGWNYLDSRFTGVSSHALSGLGAGSDFEYVSGDTGVAEILSNFELTSNIPQMVIQFEKTAVEAGTRRLATKWSIELEQDVKNMQGIDIDNEMTNAMSYELQAEIDREMLMRMIQITLNAGLGQGYSFWDAASADARWVGERGVSFYQKILVEANRVAIRNRRGPANFIIATPRVCAMLEMLPEMKFFPVNSSVSTQGIGVSKVGQLAGRFTVYRDTRTDAQWMVGQRSSPLEYCLLGFKGAEYYDTGIVYCPYIPVMIQRTIGPNDFAPRVGLMTRYGVVDHIFGAQLYYHTILVRGLGTSFVPGAHAVYL